MGHEMSSKCKYTENLIGDAINKIWAETPDHMKIHTSAFLIDRLIAALRIYYYAGDEELNRLAENAFSGCAGTQRENQFELERLLEKYND